MVAPVSTTPDEPRPDPRLSALVGGFVYSLLLVGGVGWLWARDRLGLLSSQAIGEHGVLAAVGVGLGVGVGGALVAAWVGAHSQRLAALEAEVRHVFAGIGDAPLLALLLVGAIAEEVFFRLAVQDVFGLGGSVAAYVLVNSTTANWAWIPITALHATVFGLLMHSGFGLLGTTTANAVLNYLCLRRILTT